MGSAEGDAAAEAEETAGVTAAQRSEAALQAGRAGESERGQSKATGDLEGASGARDDGDRLTERLAPPWVN